MAYFRSRHGLEVDLSVELLNNVLRYHQAEADTLGRPMICVLYEAK